MTGTQDERGGFSPSSLGLGLVTAALAGSFRGPAGAYSARSVVLLGLVSAGALAAASRLFGLAARRLGLFSGRGALPRLAAWGFFLWFAAEAVRTAAAAQMVCREHFGTNALLAVLPVLLLFSWQMDAGALDRSARALWWLLAAGLLVCLAGVWDQMRWQRLLAAGGAGLLADGWPPAGLYPEYFALPLLAAGRQQRRGALLPFWPFAAQAGYALALELVLGRLAGPDYTGVELLRAWALGYFSRLDALLLLVWLAAALWRICLLAGVLRALWRLGCGQCPQDDDKGAQAK